MNVHERDDGLTTLRTIVIGLRWWGQKISGVVADHEKASLVGVVDLDEKLVKETTEEVDVPGYLDYNDAFDELDIDVAIVAVGPDAHVEVASSCLERGIHTYLEKPAGPVDDPEAILRLDALAAENEVTITPGYSQRYHPYAEKIISLVNSGQIGRIRSIDVLRQADWNDNPQPAPSWGIHDYDLCCLLADSAPAEIDVRLPQINSELHAPTAEVLIQHENGILSRCKTNVTAHELDITMRVHGEDGEVVGNRQDQWVKLVTPSTTWERTVTEAPYFLDRALDEYFSRLQQGDPPFATAQEVVRGRMIQAAVYKKIRSNSSGHDSEAVH